MKLRLILILLIGGLLLTATAVNADIIGDFDDAGTPGVDTYKGIAGDGWAAPWVATKYEQTSGCLSADADKIPQLMTPSSSGYLAFDSGNDNYLSVRSSVKTTVAAKGGYTCSRDYTDGTDTYVDFTEDYTIAFSVRVDEDYITQATNGQDSYGIFASATANAAAASRMWWIGTEGVRTGMDHEWFYYYNVGGANQRVDTNLLVDQYDVFDMVVTHHVDAGTYDLSIVNTTTSESFTVTDVAVNVSGYGILNFVTANNNTKDGDVRNMAVDNIRISNVPEPGTMILFAGLLAGLLFWRKK